MLWSKFFRFALLVLFTASLQAQNAPAPATLSSQESEFDLPVPMGMPVNGIKIPQYDEDGKLLMLLEAGVAKKVDDKQVEMESLKLEALDGEGRKIFVELPQALFNLETRILTGENSAKISREDFEITGDSIEFNTKTRFGTLRGNVKMVISTEGNPK
jgi:hypothetical protein